MSSSLLSCRKVGKSFDGALLFENVTFTVRRGERVGFIGANGSGKSTLLSMIMGETPVDTGVISVERGVKMVYVPQTVVDQSEKSGGEKMKARLRTAFATSADVYLLDEPTNNLDKAGIEMLETFMKKSQAAFILVSHDRAFLERHVTKILYLDAYEKTLHVYDGTYSDFVREHKEQVDRAWRVYEAKEKRVQKVEESMTQKVEWVGRTVKQRLGNKNLGKYVEKPRAADLRDVEGRMGRRGRILRDRLEKGKKEIEHTPPPRMLRLPRLDFTGATRSGELVFETIGAKIGASGAVLQDIDVRISYGDRIRFVGVNGAGKTTLIETLVGKREPLSGQVRRGTGLVVAYMPQEQVVHDGETLLQAGLRISEHEEHEVRELLHIWGFSHEVMQQPVSLLSHGERSRLLLSMFELKKPNCIILDEPTNHLDLEAMETLEGALREFTGALIVASHDEYFIEHVGITKFYSL
jgi:ATPase subunit of ABC transporter with duplicated ATPase domains